MKGQEPRHARLTHPHPKREAGPGEEGYPSVGTRHNLTAHQSSPALSAGPSCPITRDRWELPSSRKGGAGRSILLEPNPAPGAVTLQHHCGSKLYGVHTKLPQTAGTANPSLIPPSATSTGNCRQLFPKQAGSFFPLVSFC